MAIKYYLQPNPITPDPNDQSARVVNNKVHDADSIATEMLKRGSTITKADILAVLNVFFTVVGEEVADGNSVNLPLMNIRAGVTGVFSSVTDSFDASRHIKKANLSAGIDLIRKMNGASVEKITVPITSPALIAFNDVNSQTTNSLLTPGGIAQLMGEELKFNPANAAEGIFFIAADNTTTQATVIASRTEGKIVFSIPSLPAGDYTLEVRKGYGTRNIVVRAGALQDSLHVN